MGRCLFGHPNRADGATLSGGAWLAALPLTNLQDPFLHRVARSSDDAIASTLINADLGAAQTIRAVALIAHNISLAGLVRVRGDDAADFATALYDSGWIDAIPDVYPSSMPQWTPAASQTGALLAAEYAAGYVPDVIHILPAAVTARYWRIEIDDTANADTYVQIGRLVIASPFQPTVNFTRGAQLGWRTTSTYEESDGGAIHHQERPRRRFFSFTLPEASNDEAMVHQFELNRILGTHADFLWVFDDADTIHLHRRAFLATLAQLNPMEVAFGSRWGSPFTVMEKL